MSYKPVIGILIYRKMMFLILKLRIVRLSFVFLVLNLDLKIAMNRVLGDKKNLFYKMKLSKIE